jgi:hypothetical protein
MSKNITSVEKALKMIKKIDNRDEAIKIVNVIMASFNITAKCLGR